MDMILTITGILGMTLFWNWGTPAILFRNKLKSLLKSHKVSEIIDKTECIPCSSLWIGVLTVTIPLPEITYILSTVVGVAFLIDKHYMKF
jgi:hypothetical protein